LTRSRRAGCGRRGGNALFLKELVLEATGTGALRHDRGSWRLHGAPRVPSRLVELIGARLAALGDAALDVLAVAERIDLDELGGLVDRDVLGAWRTLTSSRWWTIARRRWWRLPISCTARRFAPRCPPCADGRCVAASLIQSKQRG
jgi:hypothetical protein